MTFSRFACWTADHAAEAIAIDATESSDAVFLATHHPAHILQRPPKQAGGGTRCTEEQVRELLLTDPADPLIIPVVGQSGSGKSHLVRWLKASLREADERLHVVHIPKYDTSLKRVIERVIAGFSNNEFNEVRERLAASREAIVEAETPGRLLNELALSFEKWQPRPDDGPDFSYFEYLAGEDGLASLLYDKVFRRPLLAKGGTIRRFVDQALHGKQDADKGEPLRFNPDDLPTTPANVKDAAPGVRSFYRDLIGDRKLLELAAHKLTEFLQPVVRDLIGVSAQEMGWLFQRVRELLAGERKELILLIEDFTVLQAIQRELLDALLVPAKQEGREAFCPLRTVLAVTTGYFRDLEFDTVETRLRYVLDLDAPLADISASSRMDFVGRYLNAARLGEDRLASAIGETPAMADQSWVPNACDDCDHKAACHEAFGTTQRGHGLYPFNAAALNRCMGSHLERPDVQGRFDPRVVLKGVLEYALVVHRDSLVQGTFPNNQFSEHFKHFDAPELGAFVEEDIEAHDAATAARRKVLLTFWGNAPQELVDLHSSIHDAFDISRSGTGGSEPRPRPSPQPPPPSADGTQLERDLQDFAKWRKGEVLPQSLERRLRGLVHGNIVAHMDWERLVLVPKTWTDRGKAFSTDRILFRDERRRDPPSIYLAIDRDSASDASAIEALLKYEHYRDWSFENGARAFRTCRIALDRWTTDVRTQLENIREEDQAAFESAVHALVFGAIVCGLVDARSSSPADLIDAIFASIPDSPSEAKSPWEALQAACAQGIVGKRDSREELQMRVREAGTSKGGRGPQMVDAAKILPVLLARVDDLGAAPASSESDGASQHLKYVLERLPDAVAARHADLEEWLGLLSTWCKPEQLDAEAVVHMMLAIVGEARASAVPVQPLNAPQLLKDFGARFVAAQPLERWREVTVGLGDFDSSTAKDRLAFLAQLPEDGLGDIRRFIELSNLIIADLEHRVAGDSEGSMSLVREVESALEELHREFELTGTELKAIAEIRIGS